MDVKDEKYSRAWLEGFVGEAQSFRGSTGRGLDWFLGEHRRLESRVEPEFISLEDVPVDRSVGLIRDAEPTRFRAGQEGVPVRDRQSWLLVRNSDWIQHEPGSWAELWSGDKPRSVNRGVLDLHSGGVDSNSVFSLFGPKELRDRYPKAETVKQMLFRGTHHADIHFRAQDPEIPLIGHHSYDLSLTNFVQHQLSEGLPQEDVVQRLKGIADDAYIRDGRVYREGMFATSSFDSVERYLKGFNVQTFNKERVREGGSLLNVFTANRLAGGDLYGDEFVVNPVDHLYTIGKDLLGDVGDVPAELFAVNPDARFLTQRREYGNLQLHSGRPNHCLLYTSPSPRDS